MDKEQIKKIVEDSFLKADHEFENQPVCLEISGQYGNQIFATLGNFSTVLAPPKVGKTTAIGVIISSLLTGKQFSNFVPMLPADKQNVVWADTEQGKPECVKIIQSISLRVTGNAKEHPDNLKFITLRRHGKTTRIQAIEYLIYNTPNLGVLVIDGVRDLVSSINDEKEATIIADLLLKWSQELNIHIICILHENKGDKNARGHVGTELMNKAETVVTLSRGDNNGTRTTIVESKFARHKEFETFAFTVENGSVIESEIEQEFNPRDPKVSELTGNELGSIVKIAFENNSFLPYSKSWQSIKMAIKKIGLDFGDNKAKDVLKRLCLEKYIIRDESLKHYTPNVPV